MLHEQRMAVPDSPEQLRAEYEADLAAVVDDAGGPDAVAETTDVDAETVEALAAGESADLTLAAAAQIQALAEGAPDAETIETMATEHLLLGMSSAVLDVDAVESDLAIEMDAKEIQQKIERRAPMSLAEFAHVEYVIVDGMP